MKTESEEKKNPDFPEKKEESEEKKNLDFTDKKEESEEKKNPDFQEKKEESEEKKNLLSSDDTIIRKKRYKDKKRKNKKADKNSESHHEKKEKKQLPWPLQVMYGIIMWICLLIDFIYPYHYLKNVIAFAQSSTEEASKDVEAAEAKKGTYCTLKSNSLDGVGVYADAGDTTQIAYVPEGKCLQLLSNTIVDGKEWAQIDYCGINGWLPMEQLHFISQEAEYIQVGSKVYMNSFTELGMKGYAEASTSSEVVKEGIKYGEEYEIQVLENGWGQVTSGDQTFWINMYHMGSYNTKTWKVQTLSSSKEINLREEANEEAKSLGKVPEDTIFTIEHFQNGWGQVEYEGNTGWVMLHYMIPVEETSSED